MLPDRRPIYRVVPQPGEFRITHIATDSRVATCYDKDHADFVVRALNAYSGGRTPKWLKRHGPSS